MLAAGDHPALRKREVSIHAIEPASAMTRMGEELWLEFGCAAEARRLNTGFVERMIDDDSIFSYKSTDDQLALDASAESWLLGIHAFYDESRREINRFLVDYRKRHANGLRYELLTTHKSKGEHIDVGGSGEWIALRPARLTPIWKGTLTKPALFMNSRVEGKVGG